MTVNYEIRCIINGRELTTSRCDTLERAQKCYQNAIAAGYKARLVKVQPYEIQ